MKRVDWSLKTTINFACIYCKRKRHHIIVVCYKLQNKNKTIANHQGKQPANSGQVNVARK